MSTPATIPAELPVLVPDWEGTFPGTALAAGRVRAPVRSWLASCPAGDDIVLVVN